MASKYKKPSNCIDCPSHEVLLDPDPYDWFCDDDVKVVCNEAKRNITVSCRPYNIRRECNTPKWCPLKAKKPRSRSSKG